MLTLWGHPGDDEKRKGPHPLQTVWELPSAVAAHSQRTSEDTGRQERARAPAHRDEGREELGEVSFPASEGTIDLLLEERVGRPRMRRRS